MYSIHLFILYSYTQELPTRFKKDFFQAASLEHSDRIVLEGMQRVLANIGASHRLSPSEVKVIFDELGNEMGEIPVKQMAQIL